MSLTEINLNSLDSKELETITGGEQSLWQKYVAWVKDQLFPPEHDHETCGMDPAPGGGHLFGTGVDR